MIQYVPGVCETLLPNSKGKTASLILHSRDCSKPKSFRASFPVFKLTKISFRKKCLPVFLTLFQVAGLVAGYNEFISPPSDGSGVIEISQQYTVKWSNLSGQYISLAIPYYGIKIGSLATNISNTGSWVLDTPDYARLINTSGQYTSFELDWYTIENTKAGQVELLNTQDSAIFKFVNDSKIISTTVSTISQPTASQSTTSTSVTTPRNSGTNTSIPVLGTHVSSAVLAGAILGSILGTLIVIGVVVLLIRHHRKGVRFSSHSVFKRKEVEAPQYPGPPPSTLAELAGSPKLGPQELPTESSLQELPGSSSFPPLGVVRVRLQDEAALEHQERFSGVSVISTNQAKHHELEHQERFSGVSAISTDQAKFYEPERELSQENSALLEENV